MLSLKIQERIENGFNPNKNRGHKKSYLENSFEEWLLLNNYKNYEYNKQIKIYKDKKYFKSYYIDFYFPIINIGIELDGSQHKNNIEYDINRDKEIFEQYNIKIIRISHKEYLNKTKLNYIENILFNGA